VIYAENIYIALAGPMLFSLMLMRGQARRMVFFLLCGMTASLLSAYLNSFGAAASDITADQASLLISPLGDEVLKLLPVLFYVLLLEPRRQDILSSALTVGLGFTLFENSCYIVLFGSEDLLYMLLRGFSTGAMHTVCSAVTGFGLTFLGRRHWPALVSTVGMLSLAATYHAVYNLLVLQTGAARSIGYALPFVTGLALAAALRDSPSGWVLGKRGGIQNFFQSWW